MREFMVVESRLLSVYLFFVKFALFLLYHFAVYRFCCHFHCRLFIYLFMFFFALSKPLRFMTILITYTVIRRHVKLVVYLDPFRHSSMSHWYKINNGCTQYIYPIQTNAFDIIERDRANNEWWRCVNWINEQQFHVETLFEIELNRGKKDGNDCKPCVSICANHCITIKTHAHSYTYMIDVLLMKCFNFCYGNRTVGFAL